MVWIEVPGGGQIVWKLDVENLTVALDDPDAAAQAGVVWIDVVAAAEIDASTSQQGLVAMSR